MNVQQQVAQLMSDVWGPLPRQWNEADLPYKLGEVVRDSKGGTFVAIKADKTGNLWKRLTQNTR